MGPRASLWLLAAGWALLPLGVLCIAAGVVGYNAWAVTHGQPTISDRLALWGKQHPILPAVLSLFWFGGLCGGLFGLGCLMVGHWWWK